MGILPLRSTGDCALALGTTLRICVLRWWGFCLKSRPLIICRSRRVRLFSGRACIAHDGRIGILIRRVRIRRICGRLTCRSVRCRWRNWPIIVWRRLCRISLKLRILSGVLSLKLLHRR